MATAATAQVLSKSTQSFYRPELDVLRFFAFLAVFIHHITFKEASFYTLRHIPSGLAELLAAISRAGNLGVDLFFLLSAYLITTLLLREQQSAGSVNLKAFYVRRILRIWPLYFLALLIGGCWRFVQPGDILSAKYIVAYIFLAGNWMHVFYGAPGSPMVILWSVAVEEQFYLTWPAVLKRFHTKNALIGFSVFLLCFTVAARWYVARGPFIGEAIGHNTLTRLDSIAVGILIAALLQTRIPSLRLTWRVLLAVVGLAGLVFVGYVFKYALPTVLWAYTLTAASAAALFFGTVGSSFAPKPLVYLGKISYGLYIYHFACIDISGMMLGDRVKSYIGYPTHMAVSLVLTIAVASLSYRFIETPFLRLKERFTSIHSRPV